MGVGNIKAACRKVRRAQGRAIERAAVAGVEKAVEADEDDYESFLDDIFGDEDVDMRIGVFSPKAAKQVGTSFYRTPDGKEVEVTCVGVADADGGWFSWYKWDDTVLVGEVTDWIRKGRKKATDWFVKI